MTEALRFKVSASDRPGWARSHKHRSRAARAVLHARELLAELVIRASHLRLHPGNSSKRNQHSACLRGLAGCEGVLLVLGIHGEVGQTSDRVSSTLGIVPVSISRLRSRSSVTEPFTTTRCCSSSLNATSPAGWFAVHGDQRAERRSDAIESQVRS
jgi:hypothetical protein